jgi:hypothetical protein
MSNTEIRRTSGKRMGALLLGTCFAACATLAGAQHKPVLFEGKHRIGIEPTGVALSAGQCLIRGNNGQGEFVRYNWGQGPLLWCGFPTQAAFLQNRQGVFEIVYVNSDAAGDSYLIWNDGGACLVANPGGTTGVADCGIAINTGTGLWRIDASVHVGSTVYASIRAKADNRCLIFSNSGHDERPTLYRWAEVPNDTLYCGLGIDALMHTGQGLFTFTQVAPPN